MATVNVVLIGHDAFARQSYARQSMSAAAAPGRSCGWCGRQPRTVYRYTTVGDADTRAVRFGDSVPAFCNFDCFKDFHS